jgi:hypothetical protein
MSCKEICPPTTISLSFSFFISDPYYTIPLNPLAAPLSQSGTDNIFMFIGERTLLVETTSNSLQFVLIFNVLSKILMTSPNGVPLSVEEIFAACRYPIQSQSKTLSFLFL